MTGICGTALLSMRIRPLTTGELPAGGRVTDD
jgi:hypothetical protein